VRRNRGRQRSPTHNPERSEGPSFKGAAIAESADG